MAKSICWIVVFFPFYGLCYIQEHLLLKTDNQQQTQQELLLETENQQQAQQLHALAAILETIGPGEIPQEEQLGTLIEALIRLQQEDTNHHPLLGECLKALQDIKTASMEYKSIKKEFEIESLIMFMAEMAYSGAWNTLNQKQDAYDELYEDFQSFVSDLSDKGVKDEEARFDAELQINRDFLALKQLEADVLDMDEKYRAKKAEVEALDSRHARALVKLRDAEIRLLELRIEVSIEKFDTSPATDYKSPPFSDLNLMGLPFGKGISMDPGFYRPQ